MKAPSGLRRSSELVLVGGRRYKEYRGMGSLDAMRAGSADRYFQAEDTDGPTGGTMSGTTKVSSETRR